MFKRIMSVMLAVVMLMSVAVVASSAAEASDKLYIRVNNETYYEVEPGQKFIYVYLLASDKKICSLDCSTFYDEEGIKFVPCVDEYGDWSGAEYPNINTVFNHGIAGEVIYNYSNVSGNRFPVADTMDSKNVVFQGNFEVTAETGIYDIYTDLKVLGDNNNNKLVFDSEVVDDTAVVIESQIIAELEPVDPSSEEPSTEEPSTEEPSTEEPSTDEPSTDEPSTEEPSTDEPSEDESSEDESSEDATVPAPASPDQSSTDDEKTNGNNNNAVKTGATSAAIVLFTVLVMAAGLVMFSRKRSNG